MLAIWFSNLELLAIGFLALQGSCIADRKSLFQGFSIAGVVGTVKAIFGRFCVIFMVSSDKSPPQCGNVMVAMISISTPTEFRTRFLVYGGLEGGHSTEFEGRLLLW
jgi:hypothetical protein